MEPSPTLQAHSSYDGSLNNGPEKNRFNRRTVSRSEGREEALSLLVQLLAVLSTEIGNPLLVDTVYSEYKRLGTGICPNRNFLRGLEGLHWRAGCSRREAGHRVP